MEGLSSSSSSQINTESATSMPSEVSDKTEEHNNFNNVDTGSVHKTDEEDGVHKVSREKSPTVQKDSPPARPARSFLCMHAHTGCTRVLYDEDTFPTRGHTASPQLGKRTWPRDDALVKYVTWSDFQGSGFANRPRPASCIYPEKPQLRPFVVLVSIPRFKPWPKWQ